jgi:lon-related putative ATP-dependent protease
VKTLTALDPGSLRQRCDPAQFAFETTAQVHDLEEVVGQARALEALDFAVGMERDGYNLYALGPPGIGKRHTVRQLLEKHAASKPRPDGWCYVNNFEDPQKPRALRLPAGMGVELRKDLDALVRELRSAIPAAFEREDFRAGMEEIQQELRERHEHAFGELQKEAEQQKMTVLHTPHGFAIAPVKDGEVLDREDFDKLSEDEQHRIEAAMTDLRAKLKVLIEQAPQWQHERRDREAKLVREFAEATVDVPVKQLEEKYAALPEVLSHLEEVRANIIDNVQDFRRQEGEGPAAVLGIQEPGPSFTRYQANVLVDHRETTGAPVVYESNPSYQNLIGRVEHLSRFGTLVTDFTLIRPGALHRANGGYLVVDARKVLMQPYAWEGLKRALHTREVVIESLGQALSLISTVSLEPQPIPLDLKAVLLGDRLLYYLLSQFDPDFDELFKVAADFEEHVVRDEEHNQLYARLVATLVRREGLRPFDRSAVARVIEEAARLAGDSERLSTHMRSLTELLHASDHYATRRGAETVDSSDVERAIDSAIRRQDRIRSELQDAIRRGTLLIDTDGAQVGQVNALSVLQLGNFAFGQPSRVTATARVGKGEVIDIEREAEMGGSIHSKGVMILSAFLAARYSRNVPLSLAASLVFEQSYGMVEGDSASVAELCALLSALADLPIRQSLAITGSVNQRGRVQAIGGVNEKIEGFYDVCRARGLSGEQGVIIPQDNVKHLMLRREVVEDAAAGRFGVFPVRTVDDAVSLLTGVEAGERDERGAFPPESVNGRVEQRLLELALIQQEFGEAREAAKHGD